MSNLPMQPLHTEHASAQLAWFDRLAECEGSHAIVATLIEIARSEPHCASAQILRATSDRGTFDRLAGDPVTGQNLDWLHAVSSLGSSASSGDGRQLAIPLVDSGDILLLAGFDRPEHAPPFLQALSGLLHVAGKQLERAVATEALQATLVRLERSERLQRALFAIADLAGSDRAMPDMLRGIHQIVGTLMYAENFFIVRYERGLGVMRFIYYVDAEDPEVPENGRDLPVDRLQHTLTWYVLHDGKALMGTGDELREQVSGPIALVGPDSFDWMGVPMVRDGEVQGALVVQRYDQGSRFTREDRALLEFVGSHILTALERKQSQDELEQRVRLRTIELAEANEVLQNEVIERQRAEQLQAALFQIAQLASADIGEEEFFRRVHAVVGELINAENFAVALLSEDRRNLEFPYFVDAHGNPPPKTRALGQGLSEYVIRNRRPLMGTLAELKRLAEEGEVELMPVGMEPTYWLGVPLFVSDEVIGLLVLQSYAAEAAFGPGDQDLLSFVASQIANSLDRRRHAELLLQANVELEQRVEERTAELREEILARERIQEQLKHQVMHDALTGLPNRSYLRDRLDRLLGRQRREPNRQFALLYLDVDRFKVINDSLGHLAGDEVLKEVSRRLLLCVRDQDVAARLSGDEFSVLLEDVDTATAIRVAERIIQTVAEPLEVVGKTLEPAVSVGVALSDPSYQIADEILRDADTALYRAKETGRKRVELFDDRLQKRAVDVLALEGELRTALVKNEFVPYFQPIIRLKTGQVVGYEALIRWQHPTRGIIGPAEFLQIAEDSGNVEAIDWRMFELSCRQAVELCADGSYISINVSPLHFRRADFHTHLIETLRKSGLQSPHLLIEVTEGSLLDQPEQVRATLAKLSADGINAGLDDFGTGYSSLSYLHAFPLRLLKIDRSFVAGLGHEGRGNSATVVSAVIELARALNMEVVAEGIETEGQRDALIAMGCSLGQGFLLGRPAPLAHWLERLG